MLVCLTINHRNSSFEVLEKLAACDTAETAQQITRITGIRGVVVVSTCNRFEAYLEVRSDASTDAAITVILEILSNSTGVEREVLRRVVSIMHGDDVSRHLFSVSAGLKSVVIGEDEIAGQVRRSLDEARRAGRTSARLERLFQTASRASKAVKSSTAIGRADRSLVRLGLDLAASRVADWHDTAVLLIGTGQYAATTVAALRDRGATDIRVFSPSGRGAAFALKHALVSVGEGSSALAAAIADVDIVITCTSHHDPVVTGDVVAAGRRRLMIDLGLPRNVAPEVAQVPGVELLDLETIRLHAPLDELTATADAHAVIDSAASRFSGSEAERRAAESVIALRRHVLAILDDELQRARRQGTWSEQGEADLRHFVGVLLHSPSLRAKDLARRGDDTEFAAGLSAVFGIEAGTAD